MIVNYKLCMTKDVGIEGNLFGGNMLAWMDESAAIYARMVTGEKKLVTKKFCEIEFKKPVRVGDIVKIECSFPMIHRTSVEFVVCATVKDEVVFCTTAVFVALDEYGNKKDIVNKRPLVE